MGEVYPIGQTLKYFLSRIGRHRRAGRFDQAMALLSKARSQFGFNDEIEIEFARTYDEMGCEDEACRSYLRVARRCEKHRSEALFQLALTAAQHGDLKRADSYLSIVAVTENGGVSEEMVELLRRQIQQDFCEKNVFVRSKRAKLLERRALQCLNEGRIHAAKRNINRAIRLQESVKRRLLKACCHLLCMETEAARHEAENVLQKRPGSIQAKCLLVDALHLQGKNELAKHVLFQAVCGARATDSLLNVAIECAKYGYNEWTLILTRRILKREPYHVRALAMRACAYMNIGQRRQAERLFFRLCVLLPEDSVFTSYHRLAAEGDGQHALLSMAQDVLPDEAMERSVALVSLLQEDPSVIRHNAECLQRICRLADWAMHSPMAGVNVTLIAMLMLGALDTEETRELLFDGLVDPKIDDGLKQTMLQIANEYCNIKPEYADLNGRFVRIAAGASASVARVDQLSRDIVQWVAESLMPSYPEAAGVLLRMWIAYLECYGSAKGDTAEACAAGLEYAFHLEAGRDVLISRISGKYGVSKRMTARYAERILLAYEKKQAEELVLSENIKDKQEEYDEVH